MAIQAKTLKQSELLNQLVLDRNTLEEWGRVESIWMFPHQQRVLGLICKASFLGTQRYVFKLSQVATLGANGILTHSQPETVEIEKVRQLESLLNCEVWSNAGIRIGRLVDCCFNLKTGDITAYFLVKHWLGQVIQGRYQLDPGSILSFGHQRVLITDSAAESLPLFPGSIQQQVDRVKDWLQDDYTQLTQELRSLTQQAQSITEQTQERAQRLALQAKETVQTLSAQLTTQMADAPPDRGHDDEQPFASSSHPNPVLDHSQTQPFSTNSPSAVTTRVNIGDDDDDEPWI
jgi:uncharacterized protein YrrD